MSIEHRNAFYQWVVEEIQTPVEFQGRKHYPCRESDDDVLGHGLTDPLSQSGPSVLKV